MNERIREFMVLETQAQAIMQIHRKNIEWCQALEAIEKGEIVAIRLYEKDDEATGGYYVGNLTDELLVEIGNLLLHEIEVSEHVAHKLADEL